MTATKLTKSQAGKLGGLARARALTPEQRERIAYRASQANLAKNGREQMVRASHMRWGRLTKENAPRGGEALSHTDRGVGS